MIQTQWEPCGIMSKGPICKQGNVNKKSSKQRRGSATRVAHNPSNIVFRSHVYNDSSDYKEQLHVNTIQNNVREIVLMFPTPQEERQSSQNQ